MRLCKRKFLDFNRFTGWLAPITFGLLSVSLAFPHHQGHG